ncbi:hypothetical protein D3C81_442080 [compost metagenome]
MNDPAYTAKLELEVIRLQNLIIQLVAPATFKYLEGLGTSTSPPAVSDQALRSALSELFDEGYSTCEEFIKEGCGADPDIVDNARDAAVEKFLKE